MGLFGAIQAHSHFIEANNPKWICMDMLYKSTDWQTGESGRVIFILGIEVINILWKAKRDVMRPLSSSNWSLACDDIFWRTAVLQPTPSRFPDTNCSLSSDMSCLLYSLDGAIWVSWNLLIIFCLTDKLKFLECASQTLWLISPWKSTFTATLSSLKRADLIYP